MTRCTSNGPGWPGGGPVDETVLLDIRPISSITPGSAAASSRMNSMTWLLRGGADLYEDIGTPNKVFLELACTGHRHSFRRGSDRTPGVIGLGCSTARSTERGSALFAGRLNLVRLGGSRGANTLSGQPRRDTDIGRAVSAGGAAAWARGCLSGERSPIHWVEWQSGGREN